MTHAFICYICFTITFREKTGNEMECLRAASHTVAVSSRPPVDGAAACDENLKHGSGCQTERDLRQLQNISVNSESKDINVIE